jgi:N-acetylmuramoyl-L-alanine amidase
MTAVILQSPSPNRNARAAGKTIRYVVLHYTGMPEPDESRAWLCESKSEVSAHFLIERSGRIWQLVTEAERAWHAGVSSWQGETDMNSVSVGIELVNRGHQWGYQEFPAPQISACAELVQDIMRRHNIPERNILGHSDIAPQRKEDPGELFPWQELARQGIGFWPEEKTEENATPLSLTDARVLLRTIGYDCALDGEYDMLLRRVLLAFQRHWLPRHLSGLADAKTTARLRAVAALKF